MSHTLHYEGGDGTVLPGHGGQYRHFGGMAASAAGTDHSVTIDLVFRLATNGVTVTTEVNAVPVILTSAGQFN